MSEEQSCFRCPAPKGQVQGERSEAARAGKPLGCRGPGPAAPLPAYPSSQTALESPKVKVRNPAIRQEGIEPSVSRWPPAMPPPPLGSSW